MMILFIGFVATSFMLWYVANEWFYFIKDPPANNVTDWEVDKVPEGYLLCDGHKYDINKHPELYKELCLRCDPLENNEHEGEKYDKVYQEAN